LVRAALAFGALALVACGSTVPAAQRQGASAAGELGSDIGDVAGDQAVGAATGADTSTSVAIGGAGGSRAAPRARTVGPGTVANDHSPVLVGIGVDRNLDAFAGAFGASTSQPEEKVIAAAVVADINAHGGLAGHPIKPVYTEFDSTASDWVAQDQQSCATFLEDNHVVAAVRTDDIFGPLDTCLANAGVPLVLYESYFRPGNWFQRAPSLRYVPDNPSPTRLYNALVDRLVTTRRWSASTKIGLVRYDRGDQAEIETQSVRPALAGRGLKLTDAAAVHTPDGFQDIGQTSSQLATVIVRFRQQGIDNVVFEGGDISYLFATAANSQGYAPRYALTSFDFPNGMPPDQLHGAFGLGWEPTDDLLTALAPSAGVRRCQQATASLGAHYDAAGVDRLYITCDHLYFLQAAYNAAGDAGPGALARGAKLLRAAFTPAFTFAVDASAHSDGAASARDLFFDEGCKCLVYGAEHQLP
jgi:hypothetical protein